MSDLLSYPIVAIGQTWEHKRTHLKAVVEQIGMAGQMIALRYQARTGRPVVPIDVLHRDWRLT